LSIDDILNIGDGQHQLQVDEWERARMVAFWSARGYMKKSFKPKDVLEFPWEKKEKMTLSKAETIKEKGQKLSDLINSGKIKFNS